MLTKWAPVLGGFASAGFGDRFADDGGTGAGDDPAASSVAGDGDGSGSRGGGSSEPDWGGKPPPWSQDKRFREDYSALQEYKREKAGYGEWKAKKADHDRIYAEHAQYEKGDHPKYKERDQQRFNEGFSDADSKWVAFLDEHGLLSTVQALLKAKQGGTKQPDAQHNQPEQQTAPDDPEKAPMTRAETQAYYREQRRVERIEDTLGKCIAESPLKGQKGFERAIKREVFDLMRAQYREGMSDADLDALAAKVPDFYKQAEKELYGDAFPIYAKHQTEKARSERQAPPTAQGGRIPPGMSRLQYEDKRREAILQAARENGS